MSKKKIFLIIFWFALIISFECIYKMTIFKNIIDGDFIQMIIFCLPIAMLLYCVTTLFSEKINRILTSVVMIILYVIFFAQMVYFQVFNSVFSVYSMTNGGQVFEFWRTILSTIWANLYNYICLTVPIVLYFVFRKKLFDFNKNNLKVTGITFASYILLVSLTFSYINYNKKDIYSSYNLYFNTHAPILSAKKFGLVNTMALDLNRTLFGLEEKKIEILIENTNTNSKETKDEYNILDIDFDKLKENESNENIVLMHDYFKSLKGTKKNEYTGMFGGKNVVFFLAESLDPIAIDKDLTPTLYKLANSGFDFKNYYSPLFPASTADGEFRTEWSLISSRGDTLTLYAHRNIYNPYIFANSFNDYDVHAYHNYNGDFYKRREYFKALGYKNFKSCYYGLKMTCGTFHESDLEMVKVSMNDYINSEDPFFAYYITLSGHLSYARNVNKMAQKNWSLVSDLPYSNITKGYLSSNIELDKALEYLIKTLEENGKLDDTVIVLTSDHYPYGLSVDNLNEVSVVDRNDPFELYTSDLIIWNNKMDKVTVNKVGSQLDVLPTLLNLFGKEYDSRFLMGQDLLSDSEGLVLLANRSWITDKARFNSVTGETIVNDGEMISDTYTVRYNNIVDNQFKISNMVLQNNYYKKVFDALEKLKEDTKVETVKENTEVQ